MFALPLLQFAIFYVYVNLNSLLMSFEKFVPIEGETGYQTVFVGFENYIKAFQFIFSPMCGEMIKYSLIFLGINLFVVTPFGLLFSFYIAKKFRLAGFFRVMLYLPSVLSAIVLAILYHHMVSDIVPYVVKQINGTVIPDPMSVSQESQFRMVLLYNLFLAFGTNTMLYTGAMTDINPSLIESSRLDGANSFQQFIHIYVPMIWPTVVTFIVTGLAGVFIEQMQLYSFFSNNAMARTFGYFFYSQSSMSSMFGTGSAMFTYSELSAMGIIITVFLVPVVLIIRKLLLKYGPSAH